MDALSHGVNYTQPLSLLFSLKLICTLRCIRQESKQGRPRWARTVNSVLERRSQLQTFIYIDDLLEDSSFKLKASLELLSPSMMLGFLFKDQVPSGAISLGL